MSLVLLGIGVVGDVNFGCIVGEESFFLLG